MSKTQHNLRPWLATPLWVVLTHGCVGGTVGGDAIGTVGGDSGGTVGGDSGGTAGGDSGGTVGGDSGGSGGGDLATQYPPVVHLRIDTTEELNSDHKIPATVAIDTLDGAEITSGIPVGIKIRGHLSLEWPKKNYSVEAWDEFGQDSDYDFLGMGAEEDWALHGPYVDRSLLHNVLIYQLANQIGRYAPETRWVTLALRTPAQSFYDERGVYVLLERIRFSQHRLQVEKQTDDGRRAALVQINWTDNDDPYRTTDRGTPIFFIYPPDKSRTPADEDQVLAVINAFEEKLATPEEALALIDEAAAADYFILTELAKNPDGYRMSFHFYIPIDGRITFGPLWDFDLAFGISQWDNGTRVEDWQYEHSEARYFRDLLRVESFRTRIKTRWQELRQTVLSDAAFETLVNAHVEQLGSTIAYNNALWPVANPGIKGLSPEVAGLSDYSQVIDYLKSYASQRWQWLDAQIESW